MTLEVDEAFDFFDGWTWLPPLPVAQYAVANDPEPGHGNNTSEAQLNHCPSLQPTPVDWEAIADHPGPQHEEKAPEGQFDNTSNLQPSLDCQEVIANCPRPQGRTHTQEDCFDYIPNWQWTPVAEDGMRSHLSSQQPPGIVIDSQPSHLNPSTHSHVSTGVIEQALGQPDNLQQRFRSRLAELSGVPDQSLRDSYDTNRPLQSPNPNASNIWPGYTIVFTNAELEEFYSLHQQHDSAVQ